MHAVHLLLNMVIWPFTIRFSDHDFEKTKKKNKNSYYWRKFKKKRAAYLNKHDHDVARDGKVVGHKW